MKNIEKLLKTAKIAKVSYFAEKLEITVIDSNYDSYTFPYSEKLMNKIEIAGVEISIPSSVKDYIEKKEIASQKPEKSKNTGDVDNIVDIKDIKKVKAVLDADYTPYLKLVTSNRTIVFPYTKKNLKLLEEKNIFRSDEIFSYSDGLDADMIDHTKATNDKLSEAQIDKINQILSFEHNIPKFNIKDKNIKLDDISEKYHRTVKLTFINDNFIKRFKKKSDEKDKGTKLFLRKKFKSKLKVLFLSSVLVAAICFIDKKLNLDAEDKALQKKYEDMTIDPKLYEFESKEDYNDYIDEKLDDYDKLIEEIYGVSEEPEKGKTK